MLLMAPRAAAASDGRQQNEHRHEDLHGGILPRGIIARWHA
jgi:hypothetical protein